MTITIIKKRRKDNYERRVIECSMMPHAMTPYFLHYDILGKISREGCPGQTLM
jgi:hypothetical protein